MSRTLKAAGAMSSIFARLQAASASRSLSAGRSWTNAGAGNDSRPMPLVATRLFPRRGFPKLLFAAALLGLGMAVRAGAAALEWKVEITPDGELFPALDMSQAPQPSAASPGGGNGLVSVRVRNPDGPRHVRLRLMTEGLRAPAVVEADLAAHGTLELRPRLDWDTTQLRTWTRPSAQTLRITLETPGIATQTRDVAVRVHPLDDALYYVREGRERVDLGWVFAAYVNPRDPVVDDVSALARRFDAGFDDPADTAEERTRKVLAIWTALADHGLRYAAGDPALSRGPAVYSQRVRLLADVWNERKANCLDGSVLIASVLERLAIPAFIVLVPGHAFVGYRADRDHVEFLETTLLGSHAPIPPDNDAPAHSGSDAQANFEAARRAGRARWQRVSGKFDKRHRPDYALIDIETARSYGIIPLAVHGEDGKDTERIDPAAAVGLSRKSGSQ